jgi:hypothetical protein
MIFETTENKSKFIKGDYYLKGVIHVTSEDGDFETLFEEFFYSGLESNGYFQSQSDVDIYLTHELKELDWDIEPELDRCYGVLYKFNCNYTTDYWGEHDMEIEPIELHFSRFDDKNNDMILKSTFQFEE